MSELPSVITNVLSNYRLPSGTSSGGYRDELSGVNGFIRFITLIGILITVNIKPLTTIIILIIIITMLVNWIALVMLVTML